MKFSGIAHFGEFICSSPIIILCQKPHYVFKMQAVKKFENKCTLGSSA